MTGNSLIAGRLGFPLSDVTLIAVVLILGFMLLPATLRAQRRQANLPTTEHNESGRKFEDLPREVQQQVFKRMMPLVIVLLAGIFCLLLLWALLRGWRRQRRMAGIGRKATPTEYVDAWSRHQLNDTEIEGPDGSRPG